MLLACLLLAGSAGLAASFLGAPPASAQASQVLQVEQFDAHPLVLPPTGGTLSLQITASAEAPAVDVRLRLTSPDGVSRTTEAQRLVASEPGRLVGEIEAPVGGGGPYGWWTVRLHTATALHEDRNVSLDPQGTLTDRFQVHPEHPVAGLQDAPAWPQSGGDPMHSGRSLALGPSEVPILRWAFEAESDQPFHTPVIGEDGTIYALSWGAELYALSEAGQPRWQRTFSGGSQAPLPPAITPDGKILVAVRGVGLTALNAGGAREWVWSPEEGQAQILAGPVVGPNGNVLVIRDPWTLVQLDTGGHVLSQTQLTRPDGLSDPVPRIPGPVERPRLAVTTDARAVAVAGQGLALVGPDGTVDRTLICNCTPRSVSLAPTVDIALVGAGTEVVALSLRTGETVWTTDELPIAQPGDTVWAPPAIGWDKQVYIASEDGQLYTLTLDGEHQWNRGGYPPLRGQVLVDGDGRLFVSDARRGLWALGPTGSPIWTHTIDWDSPTGLSSGLALTRSGALVWPSPDGALRMLGTNRLPVASFNVTWTEQGYRFDASASHDPDGSPLTYTWDFGDGTTGHGLVATHSYDASTTYTATLTVSDGSSTASATQAIEVNFPPEPVIVDESEGTTMRLNASGTTDQEGDPINFTWTVDGQPAGNGSQLVRSTEGPRVLQVGLTVSDGNHQRTVTRTVTLPSDGRWTSVTLALYDGDCPAGICSFPDSLGFTEGQLVDLLVVNGATRSVAVQAGFEGVPGGTNAATIEPGSQARLHIEAGSPGSGTVTVRPAGQASAPTRVPVSIQPAPSEVTWRLLPPTDGPEVGQPATYRVQLEGPPPPGQVELRLALRSGVEELVSKRVTFLSTEPINATVGLTTTPRSTGELTLSATVESLDTDRAIVLTPPSEHRTLTLEVKEQSLLTQAANLAANPAVQGALALLVLIGLAVGGWYIYRRGLETGGTQAPTPTGGAAQPDGDGTVAASFMPRKIQRFRIERVLGEGGFGTTYLAVDTVLEREVVLKEIEHVGKGQARDLLLHEARTAANLSHPNVVVIHDVIEEEGRLLIVMEHVEGGTLQDHLAEGPLPEKRALSLFADLLNGLAALHEAGIVHRDLKPSNILITKDGVAKITDFGVAAQVDGPESDGGSFVGTPRYMAPEQLASDAPGQPADLYAAGALLYEMLTGRHHLGLSPGKTPSAEKLAGMRSQLPSDDVSPPINDVLATALAREPEGRYPSAQAFLSALRTAYRAGKTDDPSTKGAV